MSTALAALTPPRVEAVLQKLGFSQPPPPTVAGLGALYAAWNQHVPFDNLRKLIALRAGQAGPLPGSTADDFFAAWLAHGTGGTCWAGHGALHALLSSLGFAALRGYATMMVAPAIPPNHGTVVVDCEGRRFLLDASMLHGEPLELSDTATTRVVHGAWGVETALREGVRTVRWRPLHQPQGLDCRIDRIDVGAAVFDDFHEQSRPWSPFNYQAYLRRNRGERVIGCAFGQRWVFEPDGSVQQRALEPQERLRVLVDELGISEALAVQVPADVPTPPPPGSAAAARSG